MKLAPPGRIWNWIAGRTARRMETHARKIPSENPEALARGEFRHASRRAKFSEHRNFINLFRVFRVIRGASRSNGFSRVTTTTSFTKGAKYNERCRGRSTQSRSYASWELFDVRERDGGVTAGIRADRQISSTSLATSHRTSGRQMRARKIIRTKDHKGDVVGEQKELMEITGR